jgi:hypothetical protein
MNDHGVSPRWCPDDAEVRDQVTGTLEHPFAVKGETI